MPAEEPTAKPESRPPKALFRRAASRYWSSDTAVMVSLAAVVGVGAGLGAVLFIEAIRFFTDLFFVRGEELFGFMGRAYVIILPAIGGLIVGPLVYFLAPEAKGHGVPEVMSAMETKGGRIRPQVILVKAIGSAITIGSGGSVGREGPIVQIGAAIGSVLGQRLHVSRRRILALVGAGAAAGVAATFNAPIAGVMFALEVLMGEFTVQSVTTMVFASVSAGVISRFFLGDHPALVVPAYPLVSPWELPLYILLGVIAALVAGVFVRVLYQFEDTFDEWSFPPYLKPVVGGLMVGVIGFFLPEVFGTGFDAVRQAVTSNMGFWLMFVLVFAKIAATSLTLGSGSSGGVFAPALFIGSMTGGVYGTIVTGLFPTVTASSGAYATVGMAAVFAAAARAPITAITILFEMTLDYRLMLPVMLATVVATAVATKAEPESIYTLKLVRRGIDFRAPKGMEALRYLTVSEVMTPANDIKHVDLSTPISELAELFRDTRHHGVPVFDEDGGLAGIVTVGDLERGLSRPDGVSTVADVFTDGVMTAYPDETIEEVLLRPGYLDVGRIPVVDREDPRRFVGALRRADILRAYGVAAVGRQSRQRRLDQRRIEHSAGSRLTEFDLLPGDAGVGWTLKELQLPPDSLVVAIERSKQSVVPRGSTRLRAGDHIVALAPQDGGVRLRRRLKGR